MAKKFTGIKRKSLAKKSTAKLLSESNAKRARATYSKRGKPKPIESKSAARKTKEKRTIRLMPLGENLVQQPPESPLTKKGMSIKGLLRNTPALMHHNAEDVRILSMKKTQTKSGLRAIKAKVIHQDPWRPDRTKKVRDVYIIGLSDPDKPISKQRKVLVSCNCENFVFTWEYANAVHGCSRVIYGNGEPPTYTNPQLVPALCKHVTAVAKQIIAKGL